MSGPKVRVCQLAPGPVPGSTVKLVLEVPVPPAVVTCSGPLEAPAGTRTTSSLVLALTTSAAAPLKSTVLPAAVAEKFKPETTTCVPALPALGAKEETKGGVVTLGPGGGGAELLSPPPPPHATRLSAVATAMHARPNTLARRKSTLPRRITSLSCEHAFLRGRILRARRPGKRDGSQTQKLIVASMAASERSSSTTAAATVAARSRNSGCCMRAPSSEVIAAVLDPIVEAARARFSLSE